MERSLSPTQVSGHLSGRPETIHPTAASIKGRMPSRRLTDVPGITVEASAASQPEHIWQRITTRDSAQEKLIVESLPFGSRSGTLMWNADEFAPRQWHLVVRREVSSRDTIKYSPSNAPEGPSPERAHSCRGRFLCRTLLPGCKGISRDGPE